MISSFHVFPIVGIHPCVDIYAIHRIKPMNILFLGVSKILKECLTNFLEGSERTTKNMKTFKGNFKSYKQVKNFFISNLNLSLREKFQTPLWFGQQIDFSMGESVLYRSGLLTENGLIGIVEETDSDMIDQVLLFLGAFSNVICGDEESADITRLYRSYWDLLHTLFRRRSNPL